jgi:hypothetical protein
VTVSSEAQELEAASPGTSDQPLFARPPVPSKSRTHEQNIRELIDREEIRDLIATYAHRVAHGLSNADLFTDDGAYIQRRSPDETPEVTRGRAALDAHYAARPGAAGIATPMIHNSLLSVHGDEASGVCSIELRIRGEGGGIMASGYYQDRFRREDGRWRFVERAVTFFTWGPPRLD